MAQTALTITKIIHTLDGVWGKCIHYFVRHDIDAILVNFSFNLSSDAVQLAYMAYMFYTTETWHVPMDTIL